jgi:nucleoside-diphosphate-sugar epimerase
MKILITGNMGYVGPSVVKQFRKAYADAVIIGYDIGYFASQLTCADFFPECRADIQYFADVRAFPDELLAGVDAIVYLAAISNDPMGNKFEKPTMAINYGSAVALAKQAKIHGVKSFVYASSCSTYGFADDSERTEDSALNPLTAYAKSKVAAESGLKEVADKSFTVSCLRFATACGMSDRLRLDLVLNDFVAAALTSNKIVILSDGSPWRPLIHVEDMARAIEWATFREPGAGGDYLVVNVGSNKWNYQVRDLAHAVARIMPGVEVEINKDAQPDKRSYRVNFDKFKSLAPDHQPQYDLPMAIEGLKAGLEKIGFKEKDFRNTNFMRLRILDSLCGNGLLDGNLRWTQKALVALSNSNTGMKGA